MQKIKKQKIKKIKTKEVQNIKEYQNIAKNLDLLGFCRIQVKTFRTAVGSKISENIY